MNFLFFRISYLAVLVAIFAILLAPLIVSDSLFFPFIVGKAIIFRALVLIAFLVWALLALFSDKYRLRNSNILLAFGLFIIWTFIANLFAVNLHKAFWGNFERMDGWISLFYLFLFFIVLSAMLQTRKLWKYFWFASLGVSIVISIIAFVGVENYPGILSGERISGTLGNPIYLGAYALFHIFIAVYYYLGELENSSKAGIFKTIRNATARVLSKFSAENYVCLENSPPSKNSAILVFLLAIAFLNTATLFFSGTRGAMLGLFAGVIVSAFLIYYLKYGVSRKTIVASAAVLLLGAVIFFVARLPSIRENHAMWRITSIFTYKDQARLDIWSIALEGIKERPLFGFGQEGYNYVFNAHYRPSLHIDAPWFDRAHNVYLDWLIAGGIPALILYFAILFFVLRAVWRYEKSPALKSIFLGLVSAYVVHSFFVFDNLITSILFVVVIAYAHSVSSYSTVPAYITPRLFEYKKTFGIIIAGLVIILMFVNINMLRVNLELARGVNSTDAQIAFNHFKRALSYRFGKQEIREQLVNFFVKVSATSELLPDVSNKIGQLATDEMSKQITESPKDARLYVMRAAAYKAIGDTQSAWRDLEKAREISPQKQWIILEQGSLAYFSGNKKLASDLFFEAYALDERFSEAAAYAGAGLIAIGDTQKGRAILQKHFGTVFPEHSFVQQVYREF